MENFDFNITMRISAVKTGVRKYLITININDDQNTQLDQFTFTDDENNNYDELIAQSNKCYFSRETILQEIIQLIDSE